MTAKQRLRAAVDLVVFVGIVLGIIGVLSLVEVR